MSIPASLIVSITPRVISSGGTGLVVTGLILTENHQIPVGVVKAFSTAAAVGEYFGLLSEEYQAAVIYFTGYTDSFKKPEVLKFTRRIINPVAAFLRGSDSHAALDELKAIKDGAFKATIDGSPITASALDFSATTSFTAMAQVIQTAIENTLTGVKVEYSSLNKAFQITSPSTGELSTITYATAPDTGTDVSSLLGLSAPTGALISTGSNALSPQEDMANIFTKDAAFVTFTTLYEATPKEAAGLNAWAMSKYVAYLFIPWTRDITAPNPDIDTDMASVMKSMGQTNFAPCFGDYRLASGIMGACASIDWNRPNGAIDLAFKRVSGLSTTCDNEADSAALTAKGYNYYGAFASRQEQFNFIYKGSVVGDYVNIGAYINAVWLNEYIQSALLNGLQSVGKVPYNESGYTFIRAWIADPIGAAVNNGVIQTGVTLSAAQKAQLIQESGGDISADLYGDGYFLQVVDPGPSARAGGDSPVISLWYTDGGAVKKINLSSTVLL